VGGNVEAGACAKARITVALRRSGTVAGTELHPCQELTCVRHQPPMGFTANRSDVNIVTPVIYQ
jgi:hypothetical protein